MLLRIFYFCNRLCWTARAFAMHHCSRPLFRWFNLLSFRFALAAWIQGERKSRRAGY